MLLVKCEKKNEIIVKIERKGDKNNSNVQKKKMFWKYFFSVISLNIQTLSFIKIDTCTDELDSGPGFI